MASNKQAINRNRTLSLDEIDNLMTTPESEDSDYSEEEDAIAELEDTNDLQTGVSSQNGHFSSSEADDSSVSDSEASAEMMNSANKRKKKGQKNQPNFQWKKGRPFIPTQLEFDHDRCGLRPEMNLNLQFHEKTVTCVHKSTVGLRDLNKIFIII